MTLASSRSASSHSAVAGSVSLAERLVRWARGSDPGGVMARLSRTLATAGLDVQPSGECDDLEALIDQVIAVADELDRRAVHPLTTQRSALTPHSRT